MSFCRVSVFGIVASPKLTLPNREFGGYIFDCDGTLVDSMPLHLRAYNAALAEHGYNFELPIDRFYANAGVPDRKIIGDLAADHGEKGIDADAVYKTKHHWFHQNLSEVRAVESVAELVRKYHAAGEKISVASGSDRSLVLAEMEYVGVLEYFDIIITPVDVERGKPAPDMFLLAAERMGVAPEDCLVFEDGQAGIDAAEAGGMEWVFVDSR